jgi:hypothetical protein
MALDSPRFGTPLESARSLGRPDEFIWRSRKHGNFELVYARKGCTLEFENDRLVGIAFHLSPKYCTHAMFRPARAQAPGGALLTADMDQKCIVELFGQPDEPDEEDLVISHHETTSVFSFSAEGRLDRWELFLNA